MYNYMQNSSCYFLKIEEQMTVRAKKRPLVHKLLTRKENKCIMKIGKRTLFFSKNQKLFYIMHAAKTPGKGGTI